MSQLITRSATINDLVILLQFEQGIIKTERPFDPTLKPDPINYYDLKAYIESPDIEVAVAELDNEIIGSGYALIRTANPYYKHNRYSYLGFMYVKPEHRGRGVNKAILDALMQWSKSKGITEIRLEVYDDNTAAKKAYEKAGFKGHMLEMRMEIS